jgi:hypothetical protein
MIAPTQRTGEFVDMLALGLSLSVTLVVLFVLCAAGAILLPTLSFSHAYVGLFSVAPIGSARSFTEAIAASIVVGWVAAIVYGFPYNRTARCRGASTRT